MDLSYLSSILDQRSDLSVISRDVCKEVQSLKDSLRKVIEEKRINLRPLVAENERLSKKTHVLGEKAQEISEIVDIKLKEELENCSCEISSLSASLQEGKLTLDALNRIITLYTSLEAIQDSMRKKSFYECSSSLQNAQDVVKNSTDLKEVRKFADLCREVVILREKLLFEMSEVWANCVRFDFDKNSKQTEVVLSIKTSSSTEIKQITQTLFRMNSNPIIQRFFIKVKDRILLPIILHGSALSVKEMDEMAILNLTFSEQNGAPHYLQVFDKMISVIEFVRTHLNVEISENNGDFIQAMGHFMAQEITMSLIKNSLSEAIPSQPDQLESFGDIVANSEKFQARLQQLGFIPHDYGSFIDDASGASIFFANKMYLSYLDRARAIMKKDLHNMRKSREVVSPDWDVMPPPVVKAVKDHFNISSRSMLMESHQISTSAQDVLDLVDAIVKELKKSEEARGLRLLYTVRNIFEMYSAVVPLQHRKLLETIPQQVALFHNNCIHFAYRLLVLACECRGTWPTRLREHYHVFLDEASSLRQLAVSSLESCVSNQRSQIIANLCDSGLAKLREGPNLDPGTERSVRQCIRQLQLVRNVWVDILPEVVYANTMGFLIDEFTQAVVAHVIDAEDISSQAASELVKIFAIIDDRLPKLFQEPKEVHRLCRKWDRFRELIFILESNLEKFSDSSIPTLFKESIDIHLEGLLNMNFWPRERFPFLPAMATPIQFQPISPHFNNPAWELPQPMIANPFFTTGINAAAAAAAAAAGPWAHSELNKKNVESEEKEKPPSPWIRAPSLEKSEFKEGRIAQYQNNESRRSSQRDRSREREDRSRDRSRRRRSRERRSNERTDDNKRGRDRSKDRRDSQKRGGEDDGKRDRGNDRKRERSPRRDGIRSRFSNKDEKAEKLIKHEETSPKKLKPNEVENKYSLESANYKTQTPNETIMIRGLAQHITENDIRQDIVQCGLLPKDIRLIRKKETGVSRGFAFVEFNNTEEALCWMELKQGVLMLQDLYRAVMQFSIVAGEAMGNSSWHPSADWDCPKCYAHNFKKRITCYKCLSVRPDATEGASSSNEISPHPTTKLMIRNLDPLTNEEELLREVGAVSKISIQSCQISREAPTNLSRGVCYLEMKNVLEAIKLYNELTASPLVIQGRKVTVCYCKLQPDKPVQPTWPSDHQKPQQYTLADVPQLAEYSARMYASNSNQKVTFLQYYTQYYTNQISQQMALNEGAKDTNSAAAVAQSAIQMAQTKKAAMASQIASTCGISTMAAANATPAPVLVGYMSSQQLIGNTSVGDPDVSSYVYDESSGYYFDQKTGLFFDATTQYYYHSQDQVFLYWDSDKRAYMAASADSKAKQEEGKEDKKKDKDNNKQDKVKVAKRIAKDMERWAKTLNQKKEVARQSQVAVQQAHNAVRAAATADIAFSVLERQESSLLELPMVLPPPSEDQGALVASYGGGSDSDEAGEDTSNEDQFHTDWTKMACLLCKRQFPAKEALQRHQQLSDLHRQNLEAWYRSRGMEPPAERGPGSAGYRDRAKERRLKFGVPDTPKPNRLKEKYMKEQEPPSYEEPTRTGIPSANVGSKMLQKMGWSEGMGLGKMNQGRTDIVQAVQRVSTAGLGVAGSSLGPAGSANSYKDNVKRAAMARFSELSERE